jgi:hypothetical protein
MCVLGVLLLIVEFSLHLLFSTTNNETLLKYASYQQLRNNGKVPKYTPHRYLGYYPTPNYEKGKNRHTKLGFRDSSIKTSKSDSCFLIVCVGGSTTYTSHIEDYTKSYPSLLENKLQQKGYKQVEVINAGAGGWGSWESLISLQFRVLSLNPDMVVIYHAINDVHPRLVWPPEAYQPDNSGYRISNFTFERSWVRFIAHKSNILRTLLIGMGKMGSVSGWGTISKDATTSYLWKFKKQYESGQYPQGIFKEVSASKMIGANPPKYFRQNLISMIDLVQRNGAQPILSTFAYSRAFKDEFINSRAYQQALKEHNDLIRKLTKEKEVPLLDFAKKFPEDTALYYDGRHVTVQGAHKKAKIFANFIEPYLALDDSVSRKRRKVK